MLHQGRSEHWLALDIFLQGKIASIPLFFAKVVQLPQHEVARHVHLLDPMEHQQF